MRKAPADQAVRDRVVRDFDTTILLEAGAGTGKTTVLVARIVALVRSGVTTLDRVVAITFTDKAAGELKLRVRDELERAVTSAIGEVRDRLARAVIDLERANLSTIHSFAGALLKERPFEAGVDPGFTVAADIAGERSFDEAWERWLSERIAAGEPVLVRALHLGLNLEALREAATVMVKERDLLGKKVRRAPFDPTALLDEISAAVRVLKPKKRHCQSEDDGALRSITELEDFAARAERLDGPALESFLRSLHLKPSQGSKGSWKPAEACTEVKQEFAGLRDKQERWLAASSADVAWSLRDLLRGFLGAYEEEKRARGLVDYQDLLLRARDVLTGFPSVRRYFQTRFDRILVDEFQDTDPLQSEIAILLAEDPASPPAADWSGVRLLPGKLFIVGDPKQSIYRFRRADIAIYNRVKDLVVASGGEVLALTTNFRTVPSILEFINERFAEIFHRPTDPTPRALDHYRSESDPAAARTIALSLPPARMPAERTVPALLPLVAETIAAFLRKVTLDAPWTIVDPKSGEKRLARPGDVALLVRKMTPEFIGHFEEALRRHGVQYRLVGGKEYYAREEVMALSAVLRAIDNPADRLSLVIALRSPFFGVNDDELFRFTSSGGVLNLLAPVGEGVAGAELLGGIFALLTKLHRLRRVAPPSEVIERLFAESRALPAFHLRNDGAQMVANLWKVLDVARAYEASAPTTLRGFVRFLVDEAQSGREEGDTPVGEQIGAAVEVVTVHKAKGLEYPIVVVGDLLTNSLPSPNAILDHAAGQGWLQIGPFKPAGWDARVEWEKEEQEAEGRRLLYVALTRARDHLVIPCLPGERKESWLDQACAGFVVPEVPPQFGKVCTTPTSTGEAKAQITWFDSRKLALGAAAAAASRPAASVEGTRAQRIAAQADEERWEAANNKRRASAR